MRKSIYILLLIGTCLFLYSDDSKAARILIDGKWGAVNSDGRIILEPVYNYVYPFRNGATVVYDGEYYDAKRAYVSDTGEFITGFEYDRAYHFFGELAVYMKDGNEGFINRKGEEVTGPVFSFAYDFKDGLAPVRIGSWQEKKMGVILADGTYGVKPVFDYLYTTDDPELFIVSAGGKSGVVNSAGTEILHLRYDYLTFKNGYFITGLSEDGKSESIVFNKAGERLLTEYETPIWEFDGDKTVFNDGQYFGVKDRYGNIIVKPVYDEIKLLPGGMIMVRSGSYYSGIFGLLDSSGQILLPQVYHRIYDFDENGLAFILDDSGYGVIDMTGEFVVPCQYNAARFFSEGFAAISKNGKWGYIDTSGQEVIDLKFDWVYDFSEGLAVFRTGDWETGKRGYIDTSGEVVIPPVFDWAYSFEDGIAHVAFGRHYDGTFGYIDREGEYIWEPTN